MKKWSQMLSSRIKTLSLRGKRMRSISLKYRELEESAGFSLRMTNHDCLHYSPMKITMKTPIFSISTLQVVGRTARVVFIKVCETKSLGSLFSLQGITKVILIAVRIDQWALDASNWSLVQLLQLPHRTLNPILTSITVKALIQHSLSAVSTNNKIHCIWDLEHSQGSVGMPQLTKLIRQYILHNRPKTSILWTLLNLIGWVEEEFSLANQEKVVLLLYTMMRQAA